jgi:hypothetical protein
MIKTGNPVISIYTEMTPNPETMKFVANKLLYPGKIIDFPDVEAAKPSPLAIELFCFPFIKNSSRTMSNPPWKWTGAPSSSKAITTASST